MSTPRRSTRTATQRSSAKQQDANVGRWSFSHQLSDPDDAPYKGTSRRQRSKKIKSSRTDNTLQPENSYIRLLGYDILFVLMSLLDPKSLLRAASVCRSWHETCMSMLHNTHIAHCFRRSGMEAVSAQLLSPDTSNDSARVDV